MLGLFLEMYIIYCFFDVFGFLFLMIFMIDVKNVIIEFRRFIFYFKIY